MVQRLRIDGIEYSVDALEGEGRVLLQRVHFTQQRIQELTNLQAVLTRAKNAYIADLRAEIEGATPSGSVDLAALIGAQSFDSSL
jgi:hypothetical protein